MIMHLSKSVQRGINRILRDSLLLIGLMPIGTALTVAITVGLLSSMLGLSGFESATNSLSETGVPMATATVQLLLPVYFAVVLLFCRCWETGQSKAIDFAATFVKDLLRSAQFPALLPILASLKTSSLALPLIVYISTRPVRERPQFVAGDDPPLIHC